MRWATAALALVILSGARSERLRAQDWRPVDRTLQLIVDSGEVSPSRASRLWGAFDAALVAELNAHTSLDSIDRLLRRRPGYAGPTPGEATLRTPNATFWRELPREAPNYFVAPLDSAPTTVLAIVQSPSTNGPSHLSIFQRRHGRWRRTSAFTSDRQIAAYRIPSHDGLTFLATLESWTRADGSESRLRWWRLDRGELRRIARADTTQLQDADAEPTDSALVITASQFAPHVGACTMCTRLEMAYLYSASSHGVVQREVSLNPWALVVDSLYAMTAKGETRRAQALLPGTTLVKTISGKEPMFMNDSGDVQRGVGRADVTVDSFRSCERYWRLRSARQPDRAWKVVEVKPGRWTGDSVVFDDRAAARPQRRKPCD